VAPVVVAKKKRHSKTMVGLNEEVRNGDFAEPLLPVRLTKTALSVFDKDEKRSDCESVVSAATHKTTNGAFKKHCVPCKRIVVNWSDHKKNVHGGVDVESAKCAGVRCPNCLGKYSNSSDKHFLCYANLSDDRDFYRMDLSDDRDFYRMDLSDGPGFLSDGPGFLSDGPGFLSDGPGFLSDAFLQFLTPNFI